MRLLTALAMGGLMLSGCASPNSDYGAGAVETLALDRNGSISVEEDQYIHFDFTLNTGGRYEFSASVSRGPNIDLFLLDGLNFQQYAAGNAFTYYSDCSRSPMNTGQGSCNLDARQYHIVLDNTNSGNASPPWNGVSDTAFVNYDFKVYV